MGRLAVAAALMREQGLAARRSKRRRSTTQPGAGRWRAPDLVKRDFAAKRINQKWYGDARWSAYSRVHPALLAALAPDLNPVLANTPNVVYISPAFRQHADGIEYFYLQRLIRVGL
jgi:hypothetical protein